MLWRLCDAFSAAALGVFVVLLGCYAPVAHAIVVDVPLPFDVEMPVFATVEGAYPYNFTTAQEVNTLKALQAFSDAIPSLGWTGTKFCHWKGITCYQSTVSFLSVGLETIGTLPNLPDDVNYSDVMISSINLFDQRTAMGGTLPNSWGKLQHLVSINVGHTSVSGTLPESWAALPKIRFISLPNTKISGSLPASWSSMRVLDTLVLYGTQLSGTLPVEWSSMNALSILQLHQNKLSGSLPPSWAQMPALRKLSLKSNAFCGCVPDSWKTASFQVVVDSKNSAADCATTNSCSRTTTTTTSTEAPSECEVPHCITCVRGHPTRCDVCSSRYVITAAQWCMKRPDSDFATSPAWIAAGAATSLGLLAAVLLSV